MTSDGSGSNNKLLIDFGGLEKPENKSEWTKRGENQQIKKFTDDSIERKDDDVVSHPKNNILEEQYYQLYLSQLNSFD